MRKVTACREILKYGRKNFVQQKKETLPVDLRHCVSALY